MLVDYDFHPDEPTVRAFRTPTPGVLRADGAVVVTEARHGDVVLRHYAFADLWFKINVTVDLLGRPIETGDIGRRFAFNCDIATPAEIDGGEVYAVDLFIDVLVRQDGKTRTITDEDEFDAMVAQGRISPTEARGARRGLRHLLTTIDSGRLFSWLDELVPFGTSTAPVALPMERAPIPVRLLPGHRRTWSAPRAQDVARDT